MEFFRNILLKCSSTTEFNRVARVIADRADALMEDLLDERESAILDAARYELLETERDELKEELANEKERTETSRKVILGMRDEIEKLKLPRGLRELTPACFEVSNPSLYLAAQLLLREKHKIEAIKLVRDTFRLALLEAKNLVEQLPPLTERYNHGLLH